MDSAPMDSATLVDTVVEDDAAISYTPADAMLHVDTQAGGIPLNDTVVSMNQLPTSGLPDNTDAAMEGDSLCSSSPHFCDPSSMVQSLTSSSHCSPLWQHLVIDYDPDSPLIGDTNKDVVNVTSKEDAVDGSIAAFIPCGVHRLGRAGDPPTSNEEGSPVVDDSLVEDDAVAGDATVADNTLPDDRQESNNGTQLDDPYLLLDQPATLVPTCSGTTPTLVPTALNLSPPGWHSFVQT